MIEKYDEKYTGRQITMDWAYVNPFTGYIYFSNLKMMEADGEEVFFSADGLAMNFSVFKLFAGTYEISELTLEKPKGFIVQNDTNFNFSDIIEKFSSGDNDEEPVHFSILDITIIDGEFHFREKTILINYYIKQVDLESPGIRWDEDILTCVYSFESGLGKGNMEGDFSIDISNLDYQVDVAVREFDLKIIEQYLKELINYGNFKASLDAHINAIGNFHDQDQISIKGSLALNDFHFGKNIQDDYLSFEKLVIAIHEINPKKNVFFYDSISLIKPYFKYERYDYLDNFQTMFGKNGANISAVQTNPAKFNLIIAIADYITEISKNFFKSNYKITRLAIYKADLKFNDYAISEKFSMDFNPLTIIADSIYKSKKRVKVNVRSSIQPYGFLSVVLSINPLDSSDFDLNYSIQNLSVAMFNPYILTYTSFPLDRGTLELNGNWHVRNGLIQSYNHLTIIDPRITKRIRNKDLKWVPMPLIMSLTRERGNVIDYEIPITGNLNNPKFHWKDIVLDVVSNIFVKPPSTPYRMEIKNVETEIEKSLSLKWSLRRSLIHRKQEKFMEKMAGFLNQNPDASITVYPQIYSSKEKEYILFYEAKKKYYISNGKLDLNTYSDKDSVKVEKMSIKDTLFVNYLNAMVKDSMLFTIQDKCMRLIGSTLVESKFARLSKDRQNEFMFYFRDQGVENRVKIMGNVSVIPYNGFSFYTIVYNGELPESLKKAYEKMNELNDEKPRRNYKRERKNTGNDL